MDIRLTPATDAVVPQMSDCACRAFENDALQQALFPKHSHVLSDSREILEYRANRIQKHLQAPDWHYIIATIDSAKSPTKVVGYAGWMAPSSLKHSTEQGQVGNAGDNPKGQRAWAADDDNMPKSMDIDTFKHVSDIIEKVKSEILGSNEHSVWCKSRFDFQWFSRSARARTTTNTK